MLPSHRQDLVAGPSSTLKYIVQSSDVIEEHQRINVQDERSGKVLWYKEKDLTEEEMVDRIVDSTTSKVEWTVHRPNRGWYIRLRSPTFPPGMFITLAPLPATSRFNTEGSLAFGCRTTIATPSPSLSPALSPRSPSSVRSSLSTESSRSDASTSTTVVHSYPPTPPAVPSTPTVILQPPSPTSVTAKLDQLAAPSPTPPGHRARPHLRTSIPRPPPVPTQITHFLLAPHSSAHVPHDPNAGFLGRALAALKNNQPSHAYSFTVSPLPHDTVPLPGGGPPPASPALSPATTPGTSGPGSSAVALTTPSGVPVPSTPVAAVAQYPSLASVLSTTPVPLLTFHDRTPAWTVHATTGHIELDEERSRALGVHVSFWVAVALTYLEFLEERGSYLASEAEF